ncbi:DUF1499 domain-containing protein [Vibrio barjaei]|uniref:DUF1499 domain-containing protein n=1 Tax=Vibrio barjaei TaxID=1676683 RepID=UPI0007BC0318|nr:DUF1499 domain-containing protein [Vibrio barjaei]
MIAKIIITLLVVLVGYMFYKNSNAPSYLGIHNGKFAPMPSTPNAVSSQTDDPEKSVDALSFKDLGSAKQKVVSVLSTMGGNKIEEDDGNYLHVVFTTPTMKYNDDVELYFDTNSGLLHYRSQSRTGYSDKGLNRERYNQFSALYNQ